MSVQRRVNVLCGFWNATLGRPAAVADRKRDRRRHLSRFRRKKVFFNARLAVMSATIAFPATLSWKWETDGLHHRVWNLLKRCNIAEENKYELGEKLLSRHVVCFNNKRRFFQHKATRFCRSSLPSTSDTCIARVRLLLNLSVRSYATPREKPWRERWTSSHGGPRFIFKLPHSQGVAHW